jgi:hypothetical protein
MVSVTGGLLTYTSGDGTVDAIWVTDGNKKRVVVTDFASPSGTLGANCTSTGAATAECTGATSALLSTLDGDDNVRVFSALPSTIKGGDGQDTLTGGPVADTIEGGAGDDKIEARDGVADTIDCGPGIDLALADANDVVFNCNDPIPTGDAPVDPSGTPTVTAPGDPAVPGSVPVDTASPAATPVLPGNGGLAPLALLPVTLAQDVVKVGPSGVATFELACAAFEVGGCSGTMFLDPAAKARKALAARRGRFGRSRFSVPAGSTARVRMSLSASARRKLGLPTGRKARMARRGRKVKSQVTVKQRGKPPVRSKVTLRS